MAKISLGLFLLKYNILHISRDFFMAITPQLLAWYIVYILFDFLFHFQVSLSPYHHHIVMSLKLLTYNNFLHRLSSFFSSCWDSFEFSRFLLVFLVIDFLNFLLLSSSRTSRCFPDLISPPCVVPLSSLNANAFRLLETSFKNLFIIISSEAQLISSCHSSSSFGKDQREDELMFFLRIRFLCFVVEFVLKVLVRFLLRPICAHPVDIIRSFMTSFSSSCQSLSSKVELVECSKLANLSKLLERFKFVGWSHFFKLTLECNSRFADPCISTRSRSFSTPRTTDAASGRIGLNRILL